MKGNTEVGHLLIALLIAKPRKPGELARLCECHRNTVYAHLKSLQYHALVHRVPGAVYHWGPG